MKISGLFGEEEEEEEGQAGRKGEDISVVSD